MYPKMYCGLHDRRACIDVLVIFYFQFRYNVSNPADGQWGMQMPDGSWTGMVKELIDNVGNGTNLP